jgi:hypothetical protein
MKRSLLVILATIALTGCAGFSFRPFAILACTSACSFDLLPPAPAASAPR